MPPLGKCRSCRQGGAADRLWVTWPCWHDFGRDEAPSCGCVFGFHHVAYRPCFVPRPQCFHVWCARFASHRPHPNCPMFASYLVLWALVVHCVHMGGRPSCGAHVVVRLAHDGRDVRWAASFCRDCPSVAHQRPRLLDSWAGLYMRHALRIEARMPCSAVLLKFWVDCLFACFRQRTLRRLGRSAIAPAYHAIRRRAWSTSRRLELRLDSLWLVQRIRDYWFSGA